jgi:hypothetical protein
MAAQTGHGSAKPRPSKATPSSTTPSTPPTRHRAAPGRPGTPARRALPEEAATLVAVGVVDEREAPSLPNRSGQKAAASCGASIATHGEGQDRRSRSESTSDGGGERGIVGAIRVRVCDARERGSNETRWAGPDGLVRPNHVGRPDQWAQGQNGHFTSP